MSEEHYKERIDELESTIENLHEDLLEQKYIAQELEGKLVFMRQNHNNRSNLYVAKDGRGGRKCYIVAANMQEAVTKIEAWGVEEFSLKKVCDSENFLLGDKGE